MGPEWMEIRIHASKATTPVKKKDHAGKYDTQEDETTKTERKDGTKLGRHMTEEVKTTLMDKKKFDRKEGWYARARILKHFEMTAWPKG
jgi:hypothetical protein